jgi:putative ABC transport system permease protein
VGTLWQDIRFGVRVLAKKPGLSALAILALTLGIGLNTAIFSLFNSAVLQPLPVRDADRVMSLYRVVEGERGHGVMSYPEYKFYRDNSTVFSGISAYSGAKLLLGNGGAGSQDTKPEWLEAQLFTGNMFKVLGAGAALGRTFLPEEDQVPGAKPVVVLNHGFWQRRFGGDANLIGQTINLNALPYTVVGIAPRDFIGPDPEVPDVWIPLMMSGNAYYGANMLASREGGWLRVMGRLKPEVSPERAQLEITLLAKRYHSEDTEQQRTPTISVVPASLLSPSEKSDVIPFAVLVIAAVGLVLFIASANVANLQLARGVSRQKELGIRISLGASRWRLIRQLSIEGFLLAGISSVFGLFLAWWTADLLLGLTHPPGSRALSLRLAPDWRVACYLAGITLLTGIVSGFMPALRISRQDPLKAMNANAGAASYRKGRGLRSILVISQVAMSLFLLSGAGLLVRALGKAHATDPGFDIKHVALLTVDLRVLKYGPAREIDFDRRLTERIAALPGVQGVALAYTAPLGTSFSEAGIMIEGSEPPPGAPLPNVNTNSVTPEYFGTLGIPFMRGRDFTAAEVESGARVIVVSESFAHTFWPGQDPVGKRIFTGRKEVSPYTVIGVVRDVRNVYLWASDIPYLYWPLKLGEFEGARRTNIFVRTAGSPESLLSVLPGLAREIDPAAPATARSLADNLAIWIWPSEIGAAVSAAFGFLALALAAIGITTMTGFAVTQRTKEIGIRIALGSQPSGVVRLLVWQTGRLVLIGAVLGLAAGVAASRVLEKFLYGLSAVDGAAFLGVTILLGGVALLACYIPARRATKVDPMVALRYE